MSSFQSLTNDIAATAYSSATEPFRIERLHKVLGYAFALADARGDKEFACKINAIHDHKGSLIVTWKSEPTSIQKVLFVEAWERVGDGTNNVEHKSA